MSHTLTTAQLDLLEAALLERQRTLKQEFQSQLGEQGRVEHAREQLLEGLDDEREHDADREVDLARSDLTLDALGQIEQALQRLHDGDFGQCSDCGAVIPFERLQLSPEVTRCIRCQSELEKASDAGKHHSL